MLVVSLQCTGGFACGATPVARGPRHWGQNCKPAEAGAVGKGSAPAQGSSIQTNNAELNRTGRMLTSFLTGQPITCQSGCSKGIANAQGQPRNPRGPPKLDIDRRIEG